MSNSAHGAAASELNGWPLASRMTTEQKKAYIDREITQWVDNYCFDRALKAKELGALSMLDKLVALRNGLIVGSIKHCRLNPRADSRLAILTMITFLADSDKGICYLSVSAMKEIFKRSREAIVTGIKALEEQGQIGVSRKDGMPNCYWPLVPAALAKLSANPVWLVEALRTSGPKAHMFQNREDAIAVATENDRSSGVDQLGRASGVDRFGDQSGGVDQPQRSSPSDRYRSSSADELVNSGRRTSQVQPCSISALISAPHPKGADAPGKPGFFLDGQVITPAAAFEVFWAAFPPGRKQDRGNACDAFVAIVTGKHPNKERRATIQELVDGARHYAASKPNPEYTPMPTTWLHGGRWLDDVAQPNARAEREQQDLAAALDQVRAEEEAACRR